MKSAGLLRALVGISLLLAVQACNLPSNAVAPETGPTAPPPAPAPAVGGCSNPLYPIVAGASWTYDISGLATDTMTHSITEVREDGFTDQAAFASGASRMGEWKCDHGALIALSPLTGPSAAVTANNVTGTFQTKNMTGVTLPATVKPGDTWNQEFDIEGTQVVSGQEVAATGRVTVACTAGSMESVTVPAGTYNAQRVDCKVSLELNVGIGLLQVPTSFSGDANMWYAPGVGPVKVDGAVPNIGSSSIQLTAYSLP